MKAPVKHFISRFGLTCLALFFTLLWTGGCATWRSDPLAGWKVDFQHEPDRAVLSDYQQYMQQLLLNKNLYANPDIALYLSDGTGRHAINVEVFVKGKNASWHYAIIYDNNNRRVSVTKFGYSRYQRG